jgi:heparanase 1
VSGEIRAFYPEFMSLGAANIDLVTWHYYPQQSGRCPFRSREAEPGLLFDPENLDEVAVWAAAVEAERTQRAPQIPVWLGETGHAQCGGEPGLSDAYEASLWWLDQLGLIARRGQPVVIRQTLSGGSYGLIDEATLAPNPDYWATLLWRRLMGPVVLAATSDDTTVRVYAHCAAGRPGAVTLLAINLDAKQAAVVSADIGSSAELYLATAETPAARTMSVNGSELAVDGDGAPVEPVSRPGATSRIELPPLSFAFVVVPDADAASCD